MTTASLSLTRPRLWLAFLCAAGAALLAYLALSSESGRPAPEAASDGGATVVVAARAIAPGAVIGEGDVATRQVAPGELAEGALTQLEQALGKVALYPIARGEQVLRQKLLPEGAEAGDAAAALPAGRVGVAVKVAPETAAGGLLRPGDRVDVAAALPVGGEGGQDAWVACTVARDVPVLAVGSEVARPQEGGGLARGGGGTVDAATVTLAASPEQALAIWAASQKGRLSLLLRGIQGETAYSPPQPGMTLPSDIADLCRGR